VWVQLCKQLGLEAVALGWFGLVVLVAKRLPRRGRRGRTLGKSGAVTPGPQLPRWGRRGKPPELGSWGCIAARGALPRTVSQQRQAFSSVGPFGYAYAPLYASEHVKQ
jgi:hypothetical protein